MIAFPLHIRKDGTFVYYADSGCDSCGAGVPSSQCCAPPRAESSDGEE